MSMDIKVKMNELRSTERLVKSVIKSQPKVSEIEKEKVDNSESVIFDLSEEGRLMSENSMRQKKEAGKTSVREEWENNTAEIKRLVRTNTTWNINIMETFRLD